MAYIPLPAFQTSAVSYLMSRLSFIKKFMSMVDETFIPGITTAFINEDMDVLVTFDDKFVFVTFPMSYPLDPPKVQIVQDDEPIVVCLSSDWSPACDMRTVIIAARDQAENNSKGEPAMDWRN